MDAKWVLERLAVGGQTRDELAARAAVERSELDSVVDALIAAGLARETMTHYIGQEPLGHLRLTAKGREERTRLRYESSD